MCESKLLINTDTQMSIFNGRHVLLHGFSEKVYDPEKKIKYQPTIRISKRKKKQQQRMKLNK